MFCRQNWMLTIKMMYLLIVLFSTYLLTKYIYPKGKKCHNKILLLAVCVHEMSGNNIYIYIYACIYGIVTYLSVMFSNYLSVIIFVSKLSSTSNELWWRKSQIHICCLLCVYPTYLSSNFHHFIFIIVLYELYNMIHFICQSTKTCVQ